MHRISLGMLLAALPAVALAQGRYGPIETSSGLSDLSSAFPLAEPSADTAMPPTPTAPQPLGTDSRPATSRPADNRFGSAVTSSSTNPLRQPPATSALTPPRRNRSTTAAPQRGVAGARSNPSRPASPRSPATRGQGFVRTGELSEPEKILRQMLSPHPGSELTGSPLSLAEVVAGSGSRSDQSQRVNAYWDLCSSVADYYLGIDEAKELDRLRQRLPAMGGTLREAGNRLQVRLGTSRLAAVAAQQRLSSLMGRSALGLPGELPCGREYGTRYSEIFPGSGPAEARQLHELIPLRYAELEGAANSVVRAQNFLLSVDRQSGQNGAGVIQAMELLALNRRAFVQIARDYNKRITRYTELSRPGRIDNGRLVAMLIGRADTRLSSTNAGVTFRSPR